jgi:coiled-coil-helix-coiled-coil-helix domain-containing protein 2
MPRRSGGRSAAPSRPSVAPARSSIPQTQSRPATTAAYPPAAQRAPTKPATAQGQQGSQGPGLFGQMASTAA